MGKGRARQLILNFIRFLLILALSISIYTGRSLVFMISIVGLLVTFIPYVMNKLFNIKIPSQYEIISLMFIYGALFLSDVRGLFAEFWWWDILLNLVAALALGLIALTILYVLFNDRNVKINPIVISVLTFCFAVAIGTLWEVFEFSLDIYYGFNLQLDLRDTMGDLITNVVGAFIVSLAGYSYMRNGHMRIVSGYIEKLIKSHPKIFTSRNNLERSSSVISNLISKGESSNLEFKSTLRTNLHTKAFDSNMEYASLKTIVAFLNSKGGTLLVGVGDTGLVHGMEHDKFPNNDALKLHFTNLIKNHIGNEYLPFIEFELFPVNDKHVLKIECYKSPKPIFLKNRGDEEFYVRNGPASIKLTSREMIDYIENHFRQ